MVIFRGVGAIVSINLHRWKRDYRVWLILIFVAVIIMDYLNGYSGYAVAQNRSLTAYLLPVLYLPSEVGLRAPKVLWCMGFLLLLCNAPFMHPMSPYAILRTRRNKWWVGECAYVCLVALIFMIFITLISILVAVPKVSFSNDWGDTFKDYLFGTSTRTVDELLGQYPLSISLPKKAIMYLNPIACQIYTFFTGWATFIVLGLLLYYISLSQKNKLLGLGITSIFIYLDPILTLLAPEYGYWLQAFSPVCWTSVECLKDLGAIYFISISFVSVAYPTLMIVLLVLIAWKSKKIMIEVR